MPFHAGSLEALRVTRPEAVGLERTKFSPRKAALRNDESGSSPTRPRHVGDDDARVGRQAFEHATGAKNFNSFGDCGHGLGFRKLYQRPAAASIRRRDIRTGRTTLQPPVSPVPVVSTDPGARRTRRRVS